MQNHFRFMIPGLSERSYSGLCLAIALLVSYPTQAASLTAEDEAAGWRLLFDGKSMQDWRALGSDTFPSEGWIIEDEILKKPAGVRAGDIITRDQFTDFEFSWEWRLPGKGNNGVKFFIIEERGAIGHEYQMLGEEPRINKGSTASFYAVLPPRQDMRPFRSAEWNHSRVVVQGNQVEHWLNGEKVLEYELGSDAVLQAVAESKFAKFKGFGTKITGHILLTDHHDEAWYRNIKIRVLDPTPPAR